MAIAGFKAPIIEIDGRLVDVVMTPAGHAHRDDDYTISFGVEVTPRRGRRFCRRDKALRERGICPCRHMHEHGHRVFTFDDWGLGPQCVECGRIKGAW